MYIIIFTLFVIIIFLSFIDDYNKNEASITSFYIYDANANKVVDIIKFNLEKNIFPFKIEYPNLIEPLEISKLVQNISINKNIHIRYDDNNHGITVINYY